ncbi:MAG: hypothetical protein WEC83_00585 [Patescibacteria group bacterium]
MSRTLRNTFFTIVVLILTTLGLSWNRETAAQHDPVTISQAVLASRVENSAAQEQLFPLTINFTRQVVRLGQSQTITFTTVPGAQLEIVTQYPNGSVNNSQTVKVTVDDTGSFVQKYKLDDFHFLGVFHVSAVAYTENRTATASEKFVLQTWTKASSELLDEVTDYRYPLVP